MKTKNIMGMLAIGIMIAVFTGFAVASDRVGTTGSMGSIILADNGVDPSDAIGTGLMPSADSNSAVDSSGESVNIPADSEHSGPNESLGTGSMDDSGNSFITPLGVDPRPGYDGQ